MLPLLTRERFEHELMKIKASVGPDHVGPSCWARHGINGGIAERCIIGTLCKNVGMGFSIMDERPRWHYVDSDLGIIGDRDTCRIEDPELICDLNQAMNLNDAGRTWHVIVDRYFAWQAHQRAAKQKVDEINAALGTVAVPAQPEPQEDLCPA